MIKAFYSLLTKMYAGNHRLVIIKQIICLAFFIGKLMSWRLWISDRWYPLAPISDSIPILPHPADHLVFYLGLILLIASAIFPKQPLVLAAFLVIESLSLIQDQTRWQPWVYEYLLLLLPTLMLTNKLGKETAKGILHTQAVIMTGVYLYSGLHKLGPQFTDAVWIPILQRFFKIQDPALLENLIPFGIAIPIIEIAGALLLLFPKFRKAGIGLFLITHAFILIYLMPSGINFNRIVWPWNIALSILICLVFWGGTLKNTTLWNEKPKNPFFYPAILLVWLLPVLSFWGLWDKYLSASLFSGKFKYMLIEIQPSATPKIAGKLDRFIVPYKYLNNYDGPIISVQMWAMHELHVSAYPERRVYAQIAKAFCKLGVTDSEAKYLIIKADKPQQVYEQITCQEMVNR